MRPYVLIFSALLLTGCASRSAQLALIRAVELHNEAVTRLESQNRRLSLELEQMKVAAAAEKGDVAAAKQSVLNIAQSMEDGMAVRVMMERAKVEMEYAREHTKPLMERLFGWTKGAKVGTLSTGEPNGPVEDGRRDTTVGFGRDTSTDGQRDECVRAGRQVESGHTVSDVPVVSGTMGAVDGKDGVSDARDDVGSGSGCVDGESAAVRSEGAQRGRGSSEAGKRGDGVGAGASSRGGGASGSGVGGIGSGSFAQDSGRVCVWGAGADGCGHQPGHLRRVLAVARGWDRTIERRAALEAFNLPQVMVSTVVRDFGSRVAFSVGDVILAAVELSRGDPPDNREARYHGRDRPSEGTQVLLFHLHDVCNVDGESVLAEFHGALAV